MGGGGQCKTSNTATVRHNVLFVRHSCGQRGGGVRVRVLGVCCVYENVSLCEEEEAGARSPAGSDSKLVMALTTMVLVMVGRQ